MDLFIQQVAQLQAQVGNLEQRVADLKEETRERNTNPFSQPTFHPQLHAAADPTELELATHLAQIAIIQSNTLFLVKQLMAHSGRLDAPVSISAEIIAALGSKLQEQEQKVDDVTKEIWNLMVSLKIPPEVALMDPREVWANAALRAYWPYFTAKQELESEEYMLQRLRVRLRQGEIDLEIKKATPPE